MTLTTKKIFGLLCLSLLTLSSCDDDPVDPVDTGPRSKFTGTFQMTKLENGEQYVMEIDTLGAQCQNCDSLQLINFGDRFDLYTPFGLTSPDYWLYYSFFNPIMDHNGIRWKLTPTGVPDSPYYFNTVREDSIKIRFKISNIDYYTEDGVPYWDTVFTHVGVRMD